MIEIVAEPDPPAIEQVFRQFRGERAFDIGANVGQSAESLVGRYEQIVSVEPAEESFVHLAKLAETHPSVIALHMAAGAEVGSVVLTVQSKHIARGQLTSFKGEAEDGHAWGTVQGHRTVICTTVDELSVAYGEPDLIKCDVEGAEVEVFRGAMTTIQLYQPQLFIEVHEASLGAELERMLRPFYGDRLQKLLHPNYGDGSWGRANHWWWVAQ